jgi:O-antigen/teichoic acid export membrane protein
MAIAFVVAVKLARFLGPEGFGAYSYALAYVSLFAAVSTLGLQSVVIHQFSIQTENARTLLGTAMLLRLAGSFLIMSLCGLSVFLFYSDSEYFYMLLVLCVFPIFQSAEIIDGWYQSKLQSNWSVLPKIVASLISAGLVLWGIYNNQALWFFCMAFSFEYFVLLFIYLVLVAKHGLSPLRWVFKWTEAKQLLSQSWPMALSITAFVIHYRVDQVMLEQMSSKSEVGIYAAAAKITQLGLFIPAILVSSVFPLVSRARQDGDQKAFSFLVKTIYDFLGLLSWSVVVPFSLFATFLIQVLYGSAYAESAVVLQIHIWTALFLFMRTAYDRWLVIQEKTSYNMMHHILIAVSNVWLNYLMIPHWGALGAALASLISILLGGFLPALFIKEIRSGLEDMLRGISFPIRLLMGQIHFLDFRTLLNYSLQVNPKRAFRGD